MNDNKPKQNPPKRPLTDKPNEVQRSKPPIVERKPPIKKVKQ